MLRFSHSYDLKNVDERYREMLSLRSYTTSFFDFIKSMFPKNSQLYNKNLQFNPGVNKKDNLLIYDSNFRHFLIHLEYNQE
uniref:Predicted protein n=1 Tax=Hordeum vulgare subsp. vulgare TaxID=112509 RepID=F2E817_HORVV|nr:predicted protein [Hordeum vulgare subsp. vulgare]